MLWLKKNKNFKIKLFVLGFLALGLFVALPALAQINTGIEFGQYTGLVNTDIRIIVAKIIRVALGLLGIVALGFLLYGGFIYMTSEGNEKKLEEAKTIIKNAVIGLVIILSAFSIAQFVITRLTNSIIDDFCTQNPEACVNCLTNPSDPICAPPFCADPIICPVGGNTFFASVIPQGSLPLYNVVVNIGFFNGFGSAGVNRTTINSSTVSIVKQLPDGTYDTDNYPGFFEFLSDSSVAFHPQGNCGSGNPATDCFATNTLYRVTLSPSIKSSGGADLDCVNHVCVSTFTTGDKYDAAAPGVEMVLPGLWAIVGDNRATTISANYSDDSGVKQLDFITKQNQVISTIAQLTINPFEANGSREFNLWIPHLTNFEKAETATLAARAYDLDNHRTTSTIQNIKIIPSYCFNGNLDTDKKEEEAHSADGITPDCGLNSECGACAGQRCYTNFSCAGGYCDLTTHQCLIRPKILNVAPLQAGAGSLITLKGLNFGSSEGQILLNNIPAPAVACPLTGNNPTWNNNSVVARVPIGNTSGIIEIRTTGYSGGADLGHFDKTDDTDWGFKGIFSATAEVLPGLICVSPATEAPFNNVTLAGENFGVKIGKVNFSYLPINGNSIVDWQANGQRITTKVPQMPGQTLSISVNTFENKVSNSVPFTIKSVAQNLVPRIDSIDPENGPVGTYLTISGANFGESGSVVFKVNPADENETRILADLPPSYCSNSWKPTQVIVKVPAALSSAMDGVSTADYYVQVRTGSGSAVFTSNWQKFTINKNPLQPGLCSVSPNNGPISTIITLQGEGFGPAANNGAVEYWQNVTSSFSNAVSPRIWENLKIIDAVPIGVKTGKIKVWSNEKNLYSRNSINFKVQNCKEEISAGKKLNEICGDGQKCCDGGSCIDATAACPEETGLKSSMFAWSFSTGQLPVVPRVVEECVSGKVPSPTPSQLWDDSTNVCLNTQIKVRFTSLIKQSTIIKGNSFIIQKCTGGTCPASGWVEEIGGNLSFELSDGTLDPGSGGYDTIIFSPDSGLLNQNTWYRVVLTTQIKSFVPTDSLLEKEMLPSPTGICPTVGGSSASYCFNFKTKNSTELCKLGSAVVIPHLFTAKDFNTLYYPGTKILYNVSAVASDNKCWLIDANAYNWQWNAGFNVGDTSIYASITNDKWPAGDPNVGRGKPNQDLTTLDKITPVSGEKVWVKTESGGSSIRDNAILYVFPSKPKIISYKPICNTACINSSIEVKFDIRVKGVEQNLQIYQCPDENCNVQTNNLLGSVVNSSDCNQEVGANKACRNFNISLAPLGTNLLPNTYYRIKLSAKNNVKSEGGVPLADEDLNYNCGGGNYCAFSWTFRTKNDSNVCRIERVKISPATSTVYWIGSQSALVSSAFGTPDNCLAEGQQLNAFAYNWSWQSQNSNVAFVSNYDLGVRRGGSSALTNYCGDGAIQSNALETCDNNTANCSTDCQILPRLKLGTSACFNRTDPNCCGNGGPYSTPEKNEECDLGAENGLPGSTCTAGCLFTTANPISLAHCVATIGGSSTTKESRCLNQYRAVPVCGNGVIENNEECDGGANCANNCLLTTGFETALGNGLIDPLQYATAIGQGTPDSNKHQKTQIYADTEGKRGVADFVLQCGYTPVDSSCPLGDADKGAGKNSCCYERPAVVEDVDTLPRNGLQTNICPNALLSVKFDQPMEENSFTSTTLGYFNIALAKTTSTPNCAQGTYLLGQKEEEPHNFWQKIKFAARRFFGRPVQAEYFCAGDIIYDLKIREISTVIGGVNATTTQAILELKQPLAENTNYRLVVFKESRNIEGVRMQNTRIIDFKTAGNLCKIDHLSLDPAVQIFTRKDETHQFNAKPQFVAPGTSLVQELMPMPGAYNWEYGWIDGDFPPPDIIGITSINDSADVKALGKNGDTAIGAFTRITEDTSRDTTVGRVFSATGTISVFLCENPWPSFNPYSPGLGLGYFDALDNKNAISEGNGWTNFKLLYCRDTGKSNDIADDLGALNLNTPLYHQTGGHQDSSGIFKEFFFTFANSVNRDSIGLRVYPNPNYLSTKDWYNSQPWIPKGSTNAVRIGSDDHVYQALQEGRTYYVNGLNISLDNKIYSNVYVFSFSDNPSSETLNVVTQLLNNFTLNVNFTGKARLAQINRDFVRFKDLKAVSEKLAGYYATKGFFPKLTESTEYGTFLPSYTNSKWKSWQLLSNSLGFGMPIDPLNNFYECGNSEVFADGENLGPYNADTCWNEANSTFICPGGSHVYQYQTIAGASSVIKADLEIVSGLTWARNLNDFLNIKLCSLNKNVCKTDTDCLPGGGNCSISGVDFQLYNSCNNVIQTAQTQCGVCTPGETRLVSCLPVNDPLTSADESKYPGQKLEKCKTDCLGWDSDVSSLIGRWTFDTADVSGNTILDKSGYGNNGKLINTAEFLQGKISNAIKFPAPVSNPPYITIPANNQSIKDFQNNGSFTFALWFNISNYPADSTAKFLISNFRGGYPGSGVYIAIRGKKIMASIRNQPTDSSKCTGSGNASGCAPNTEIGFPSSQPDLNKDQWYHLAVAGDWDGIHSSTTLFLDGQKISQVVNGYRVKASGDSLALNNSLTSNPEHYFEGLLDDARIYNRALTGEEISFIYTHTSSQTGSCVSAGFCGDGIENGPEICDDGFNNGKYGYCKADCTLNTANKCGDQYFTKGNEVCDSSAFKYEIFTSGPLSFYLWAQKENNFSEIDSSNKGWCDNDNLYFCSSSNECPTGGNCIRSGAKYNTVKEGSCAYDCQGRDYCGDGLINPVYEECEASETCQIGSCSGGLSVNKYCEKDQDCQSGQCENYQPGKKYCQMTNEVKSVKQASATGWPYYVDNTSATKNFSNDSCSWDNNSLDLAYFSSPDISCLPFKAPELPVYLANCGIDSDNDGNYKDQGEECDFGPANGDACVPQQGAPSCTYCAFGCKIMTISQ